MYGYNRFQACRFGFEAELVDPWARRSVGLREDLVATLERIAPQAERLETAAPLADLRRLAQAQANDSRWLRERYSELRSMPDVVRGQSLVWRKPSEAAASRAAQRA